jgi:hypothetical protein
MEQGAQKLILDVRYNPGGYARELVALLDYLLPEGKLLHTVDYEGNEDFDYYVAIRPDENGERRYQIRYRVHPDNATDQSVSFALAPTGSDDDGEVSGVSIDENGVVVFEGSGIASVIVHVVANNAAGEAASVSLAIFAYGN